MKVMGLRIRHKKSVWGRRKNSLGPGMWIENPEGNTVERIQEVESKW